MAETVFRRWNQQLTMAGAGILFLLPLLAIHPKTYLTLTIAGLAMGMLLFLVASGVSIIFGLMDVLNFAHGALFAWGAYVGFSVFKLLMKWVRGRFDPSESCGLLHRHGCRHGRGRHPGDDHLKGLSCAASMETTSFKSSSPSEQPSFWWN